MTKKDFIALADTIIRSNHSGNTFLFFSQDQTEALADFCQSSSSRFKRERWLGYIAGENGKKGGKVKGN